MIEIKVPTVGESINEVTLVKWLKNDGDYVERDEVIAELESEKATFEVNAEQAGTLKTIATEGDTLHIGSELAHIDESGVKSEEGTKPQETKAQESKPQETSTKPQETVKKEEAKPSIVVQQPSTAAAVA